MNNLYRISNRGSFGYDSMYSGIKQHETYIVRKSTLRLENSQVWCQWTQG